MTQVVRPGASSSCLFGPGRDLLSSLRARAERELNLRDKLVDAFALRLDVGYR
jgi:hypothetical protein